MKFTHLKTVVGAMALSVALAGTAHAQIVIDSETSDSAKVQIGISNVPFGPHTSGKVGISVPALGPGTYFVDFEGLQGTANPTANIVTTVNNPTGTITDHSQYGRFDFSKVDGYNVYYGEWSQTADASAGDHTVYFGGTDATTSGAVASLTGTADYTVYGLSNFKDNGQLTGTLTADFDNLEVTGSLTSTNLSVDIGTATILGSEFVGADAVASPTGLSDVTGGVVNGQFFGSSAQALAGIVEFTDREFDTAFGGTQ